MTRQKLAVKKMLTILGGMKSFNNSDKLNQYVEILLAVDKITDSIIESIVLDACKYVAKVGYGRDLKTLLRILSEPIDKYTMITLISAATSNDNLDTVKVLIKETMDDVMFYQSTFDRTFTNACRRNSKNIVKWMLSTGSHMVSFRYIHTGYELALIYNNPNIANIVSNHAFFNFMKPKHDYRAIFINCCIHNSVSSISYMIKNKLVKMDEALLSDGLSEAYSYRNKEVISYINDVCKVIGNDLL